MKVFVYGTLKKGFGNHALLETAKFIKEATTDGQFVMYERWFPYIIPVHYPLSDEESRAAGRVVGEVYEINEGHLADLDGLEGEGYFYERVKVEVGEESMYAYQMIRENHPKYKEDFTLVRPNTNRLLEF